MNETNKLGIPQAIILAGLIVAVAIIFKMPAKDITRTENKTKADYSYAWEVKPVETAKNDHRLGSATAQIELVEYSDTECPFCKQFHVTMHQVIDNYKGEVAWVYKQLPLTGLHKLAYNESVATECAEELGGNVAFWQYLDAVFRETTSNDGLPPSMLPIIAKGVGLDVDAFSKCLLDPKIFAEVDADIEEVKTLTDRLGTPFLVIKKNGEIVDTISGALPYASVIDRVEKVRN